MLATFISFVLTSCVSSKYDYEYEIQRAADGNTKYKATLIGYRTKDLHEAVLSIFKMNNWNIESDGIPIVVTSPKNGLIFLEGNIGDNAYEYSPYGRTAYYSANKDIFVRFEITPHDNYIEIESRGSTVHKIPFTPAGLMDRFGKIVKKVVHPIFIKNVAQEGGNIEAIKALQQ